MKPETKIRAAQTDVNLAPTSSNQTNPPMRSTDVSSVPAPAEAYSYLKFSCPQQLRRKSVCRKVKRSAAFAGKNRIMLDDSLYFGGDQRRAPTGALAQFLSVIHSGVVAQESWLLTEAMDRRTPKFTPEACARIVSFIKAQRESCIKPIRAKAAWSRKPNVKKKSGKWNL